VANHRSEYVARINRVLDHVDAHLDGDLSLARLAQIACFSPYHFHRIFRSMMGEPLSQYVQRLRLERAATHLRTYPERSVTEVALDAGFASTATFGRAFKQCFGVTASEYRESGCVVASGETERKIGMTVGKLGSASRFEATYLEGRRRWKMTTEDSDFEMNVSVETLPAQRIAYVRHVGPYAGDGELFGRLFGRISAWAGPRGLLGPGRHFVAIYHDNPEVTAPEKLRLSVGVEVGGDVEVGGEIGALTLPGGTHAIAHCVLSSPAQYPDAWTAAMDWFPDSGYQPADALPFERYGMDTPTEDGTHVVDLVIPAQPLV